MLTRTAAVLAFTFLPAFCGDWNPKLAEQYLDSRQQAWDAWPHALESGVACVSCHTGLPYLLARPALRRTLGETGGPTLYEGVLVASMRATVIRTDAKDLFRGLKGPIVDQVYGAQVVLSALVLAMDDAQRGHMSPEAETSFKRLWALQVHDGDDKGAWHWSDFDLDPWETKDAAYYGAALAALATGIAPEGYQARSDIRENIAAMKAYLHDGLKTQPLHNRLFLLMASAKMRDLLPDSERQAILDEVWKKQQPDGGWTLESLGQWKKRENAPPNNGSNAYATAVVALAVEHTGAGHSDAAHSDANLARGLAWLRSHQDPESGRWYADSMNHPHDAGTMPALFMTDAATGYATAALLAAEHSAPHQHERPTAKVSAARPTQNP
jgi:squalene-hopene/tetraprenyl-beta-curcumene cyclase